MRAGQRIVNLYADKAIELLLPELERGLFADNWRIRYSSVQLLGDLLYKISGEAGSERPCSQELVYIFIWLFLLVFLGQ